MDFSVFKNKYIITGKLKVMNALHIGSGKEGNGGEDAPFISLDDKNEFYVPGSSFRGYLSTKLERFLNKENNFNLKYKEEKLSEADVKLLFGGTNLEKENKEIQERIIKNLNSEEKEEKRKIKEIKSLAGRIHISDMKLASKIISITRDGIKIDRDTGATEKGGKFDYDVIPMGTEFDLCIELENIEEYQLSLLGLALTDIMSEEGDLFGGKTSRGIGRCRVEDLKMKFVNAEDKEKLKKYIFEGEFSVIESSNKDIFDINKLSVE